jgi:hypothetical protein
VIEYAALSAAFLQGLPAVTKLLELAGVPLPAGLTDAMTKGLPGLVDLLEAVGCAVTGCPKEGPTELDRSDVVDEAGRGRAAYHQLAEEGIGIRRK